MNRILRLQGYFENAISPGLALLVYLIWVVLSSVLLLNLLIAMMGKTFKKDDEDTDRIWIFPFAALVLKYERMLSEKEASFSLLAWLACINS